MTQDTPRGDVTPITLDTSFAFFHAAAATMAATEVPIARVFANLTLLTAAALSGQYRLRYVPAEGSGPRRVEVRVSRPGARWRVAVDTP